MSAKIEVVPPIGLRPAKHVGVTASAEFKAQCVAFGYWNGERRELDWREFRDVFCRCHVRTGTTFHPVHVCIFNGPEGEQCAPYRCPAMVKKGDNR